MSCSRSATPPVCRTPNGVHEPGLGAVDKMFTNGLNLQQERDDDEQTTADGTGGLRSPSDWSSSDSPMSAHKSATEDGGLVTPDTPTGSETTAAESETSGDARSDEGRAQHDDETPGDAAGIPAPALPAPAVSPGLRRRVAFAETSLPEENLRDARIAPQRRDVPMKVPLPAYGAHAMVALTDSMPVKKRPIFHELAGWTSLVASRKYPDLPIHKRPSAFLLAEPPRMVV